MLPTEKPLEPKPADTESHVDAERLHKLTATVAADAHTAMVHGLDNNGKPAAAFNWGAFLKNAEALLPEIIAIISKFKSKVPDATVPTLATDSVKK